MIGLLLPIKYAIIVSVVLLLTYFSVVGLVGLVTYRISKENNHSLSRDVYKHWHYIICTYVTMFLILVEVAIWLGILPTGIISLFFIVSIIIRYSFIRKTRDFHSIYWIVKNNKCEVNDYISVDNYSGKIIKMNIYQIELLDLTGNYTFLRGASIDNIINNSKNVYDIKINVVISNDKLIDKVKELLEKELPSLVKDYPIILEGPNFDGVADINKDSYTIILSTKVKYEDIDKAKAVIQTKVMEVLSK
ncbi:MAG: mechanosensitive ion channel [Bacilli bacterium]|nr:mechanosensitive ion channel [Bacilli bacterium]